MPLLSVFRNLFGQRELIKYKEVLTFHFLCPCGLCSRPHQPKIKTRCHKCFLGEPPHKRYLEPDIVLTRNERGLGTADGHSWRSSLSAHTFAIFLTELLSSPREAIARTVFAAPCGCQVSEFISKLVPRAPAPGKQNKSGLNLVE